ncbi:MAG: DNA-directed RNA polymerase subunit beta' [[Clostridium] aminophilum]|uniref:DNA-directed RNA polymerase subunit beta' n=1 Tax=[Clostridium] aminophilum TaxID=1526 RepID=UPI0026EDF82E|nr:DNA-directed RNA polymerase subunit beta' [[Clostridium] aminophilum]MDD6196725.1 DNA-directed RNA polymerase subunit beta' [[Clostridium] aminophilum]
MPETKTTFKPVTFESMQINLASPERILEWSHGEVTKPETINYRTLKPEKDGLFCEKIFGPTKDWECHCGKYKKIRYKGVVCDRCGVEVTKSSVRRERMGHITLAAPVSHIWYFKGIPSRMGLILGLSPRLLERVLYFASYIVLDAGNTSLNKKDILSEAEYREAVETWGVDAFDAQMGAEAIYKLLKEIDLEKDSVELKAELETATGQKRARIIKQLEVVEAFRVSGNRPEWMILTVVPVIPPEIRPMVQLDGGRFATSDLNDLYRRIINRNNRLARLIELGAPDIIVRNEKRMLQEAVDALIDNGRRGRPVTGPGNRALKSLSDMLKGKQGRFRQNLLGKRVDYSGRSVIVVGPEMKIYQCGLPKEMAVELFKPFVMKELVQNGTANNIKNAKKMVEKYDPEVWDVLEDVIKDHPVMLNRAPTLHRLGIQAFEPILVEGHAIRLHPLACTAFNADFDGDQMAVHLPLTVEAQAECRFMLLSPNNLLKPSDGGPVAVPSQDMVLGIYYLTQERPGSKGEGMCFKSVNEALLAYENGLVTYQTRVKVRMTKTMPDGRTVSGMVESTVGRFRFNEIIPQDLGFVDRTIPGNELKLEVDTLVRKGELKDILQRVINVHGAIQTAITLDDIKAMGYHISTRAAMTISVADISAPSEKKDILAEAQAKVDEIAKLHRQGLSTEEERYKDVVKVWEEADKHLTKVLLDGMDPYNNIKMMAHSGARGSDKQIKQLAGMRGLMADTTGHTIELPIKSNFREGLDVLEYFISAHGARKGLSDTALRTADSGYLTRRMVDVTQDLIVREDDCCAGTGKIPYMEVKAYHDGDAVIESLDKRINGRFSAEDIYDPETNQLIVGKNQMITPARTVKVMAALKKTGRDSVKIRTVLSCRSHHGVCAKCYGANMASGQPVRVGEAVGIIAAQSIGEPGTQLTMRTFHAGGVAGNDITQGLPRVEELFESRKPKGLALLSEIDGVVTIKETKKKREVIVSNNATGESKTYIPSYTSKLLVVDGQTIEHGAKLNEGSVNPHDLLRISGVEATQDYLIQEVQRVYGLQGVDINDKHIEMIVHQMLKKIHLDDAGDSGILPGQNVDRLDFEETNERLLAEGKKPMEGTPIILGITKASLATDSFMSAASFQETTKILTEAAIYGKTDNLVGLKENVIIGKLIPAGTGMKRYRSIRLSTDKPEADESLLMDETDELTQGQYYGETAENDVIDEAAVTVMNEDDHMND